MLKTDSSVFLQHSEVHPVSYSMRPQQTVDLKADASTGQQGKKILDRGAVFPPVPGGGAASGEKFHNW